MNEFYNVIPVKTPHEITAEVCGSKSITNRALLFAAMCEGKVTLSNVLFSDDSRHFIRALQDLKFNLEIDEPAATVTVTGCGGKIPCLTEKKEPSSLSSPTASVYVGSAGTAARFLTAFLGLSKGFYKIDASEQMRKRPMKDLLCALEQLGSEIQYCDEPYHFPFVIGHKGEIPSKIEINIDQSSQFLSALLIIAPLLEQELEIQILGSHGMSYVEMTLKMMEQFSEVNRTGTMWRFNAQNSTITLSGDIRYQKSRYEIEPDLSAACYFYAMGAVLGVPATVRGVFSDSLQGDLRFLNVLESMGCKIFNTPSGLQLIPPEDGLSGGSFDLSSFSDQALTLAAIAPFCKHPVQIQHVGHIRMQECDRINAILINLNNMGITAEEQGGTITVHPGKIKPCLIETFDDHRVAMAFTICGLSAEGIVIKDPMCCRKTFERYFDCLEKYLY